MSIDWFITWNATPSWGCPTAPRVAKVLETFLGPQWVVHINPFPRGKKGFWVSENITGHPTCPGCQGAGTVPV